MKDWMFGERYAFTYDFLYFFGPGFLLSNLEAEHFPSLDNGKPPSRPHEAAFGVIGAGCFLIQSQVYKNQWKPVRCLAGFP